MTGDDFEWTAGWYVVNSNVIIDTRVTVTGDVHLILGNGCTLTVNGGIKVEDPNTFTIYSQPTDETTMGSMVIQSVKGYCAGIGSDMVSTIAGLITINGGNITVKDVFRAFSIGGGYGSDAVGVVINGGRVKAYCSIGGGNVYVNDGIVEAPGTTGSALFLNGGVFLNSGNGYFGTGQNASWKGLVLSTNACEASANGKTIIIRNGAAEIKSEYPSTVPEGYTLVIEGSGSITNNGTLKVNGILDKTSAERVSGNAPLYKLTFIEDNTDSGATDYVAGGSEYTPLTPQNLNVVQWNGNDGMVYSASAFSMPHYVLTITAKIEPISVPYLDQYQCLQTAVCRGKVTDNVTNLGALENTVWYVVKKDAAVTINKRISISGDVHLILEDGCEGIKWYLQYRKRRDKRKCRYFCKCYFGSE